jgi:hypothetical protein
MYRMIGLLGVCAMLVTLTTPRADDQVREPQSLARGVVFHDANENRTFDADERPLPGIRVSNGSAIVKTDNNGRYELPVEADTILFVVKPRGWRTPLSAENLPQFYYIHKPGGSPSLNYAGVAPTGPLPNSVDFPLIPQDEPDEFRAILFGDTQPRNQQEVDWIAHDVVEELIGTEASFGVTLGDIVFDDLDVMQPLNQTIALLGIPWYNVVGNHDINFDAQTRAHANETFERVYGPSYYSFDYGPVHFVVLDNIEWQVNPATGKGKYRGGLGAEQLAFVKRDLAQIPADQLVVLMMHIPLTDTNDRHGLYRLIEQRPFCISISGHTHHHEHIWITGEDGWEGPQPHHHIINVTVCGSWWSGAPDERGIPHTTMADGAPNGYSIISFDGTNYHLDFFAAGRSPDYQMEIDAPEVVSTAELADTPVYVNVFNGSEKSTVLLRVGQGEWVTMQHSREVDPKYQRRYDLEEKLLKQTESWRKLPKPKPSSHLWRAMLPGSVAAGTHSIEVKATDRLGRSHSSTRIIRVSPQTGPSAHP